MRYLIAYDISESRRLQRVQRHMQQYARPLQRSVFLYEGNEGSPPLSTISFGIQRCLANSCKILRMVSKGNKLAAIV
jgi:CRISPR/Cas system-associated endoribonuclease Cas2